MDGNGDLFGGTINGGAFGLGEVYEVAAGSNTITPLASFNGTDGSSIWGGFQCSTTPAISSVRARWRFVRGWHDLRDRPRQQYDHHPRELRRV